MAKKKSGEKTADVTVTVDVSKIVRNVSVAGVCIVGMVLGFNTYRKMMQWKYED